MRIINKYISIDNKNGSKSNAEIFIEGDITDWKWFDDDVTPKDIRDALKEIESGKDIDIHINCYGGSVFAGNAIFNILDSYRRKNNIKYNVYYGGIGASMATGIGCIGDRVYANENSLLMIHKPLSSVYGNADEMQKEIELLNKVEDTLVKNYLRKINISEDQLRQMLADETWLTAEEAKEIGLVDEIIEPVQIAASAKGIRIGNETFSGEVSDLIRAKYPKIKIEKEDKKLEYDAKLMDFGINNEMFDSINIPSDKLLEIATKIVDTVNPHKEPVEQFVDKAKALEVLNCEDITEDALLDFAKAGMNPPDVKNLEAKAKDYDKIVSDAKQKALVVAMKAQGDSYNETRMKKFLEILDYSEIIEQTATWENEAKKILNAGKRVSIPESRLETEPKEKSKNPDDYTI